MPEIRAILLVPEEGDPHGLLREGPCGARPPRLWPDAVERGKWGDWGSATHTATCALVLAYDGKVVQEGCWRLRGHQSLYWETDERCRRRLEGDTFAAHLFDPKLGRLVQLDAEGREVPRA